MFSFPCFFLGGGVVGGNVTCEVSITSRCLRHIPQISTQGEAL